MPRFGGRQRARTTRSAGLQAGIVRSAAGILTAVAQRPVSPLEVLAAASGNHPAYASRVRRLPVRFHLSRFASAALVLWAACNPAEPTARDPLPRTADELASRYVELAFALHERDPALPGPRVHGGPSGKRGPRTPGNRRAGRATGGQLPRDGADRRRIPGAPHRGVTPGDGLPRPGVARRPSPRGRGTPGGLRPLVGRSGGGSGSAPFPGGSRPGGCGAPQGPGAPALRTHRRPSGIGRGTTAGGARRMP